jgi:hypothetical protein
MKKELIEFVVEVIENSTTYPFSVIMVDYASVTFKFFVTEYATIVLEAYIGLIREKNLNIIKMQADTQISITIE